MCVLLPRITVSVNAPCMELQARAEAEPSVRKGASGSWGWWAAEGWCWGVEGPGSSGRVPHRPCHLLCLLALQGHRHPGKSSETLHLPLEQLGSWKTFKFQGAYLNDWKADLEAGVSIILSSNWCPWKSCLILKQKCIFHKSVFSNVSILFNSLLNLLFLSLLIIIMLGICNMINNAS